MADVSHRLAHTLGDLAVQMQAQKDNADSLRAIVDAAAHIVPGARWAGISLIQGRRVEAKVPTDPIVAKLDELQSELGDGPCITALSEHHTVHIDDMSSETRWPQFTRQATELGVFSLLSFQFSVESKTFGAMNLYSPQAGSFSEDSKEVGAIVGPARRVGNVRRGRRKPISRGASQPRRHRTSQGHPHAPRQAHRPNKHSPP